MQLSAQVQKNENIPIEGLRLILFSDLFSADCSGTPSGSWKRYASIMYKKGRVQKHPNKGDIGYTCYLSGLFARAVISAAARIFLQVQ